MSIIQRINRILPSILKVLSASGIGFVFYKSIFPTPGITQIPAWLFSCAFGFASTIFLRFLSLKFIPYMIHDDKNKQNKTDDSRKESEEIGKLIDNVEKRSEETRKLIDDSRKESEEIGKLIDNAEKRSEETRKLIDSRGEEMRRQMECIKEKLLFDKRFNPFLLEILYSDEAPHYCLCPIRKCVMLEPVTMNDGYSYEREAIQAWYDRGSKMSPINPKIVLDNPAHRKINVALEALAKEFVRDIMSQIEIFKQQQQKESIPLVAEDSAQVKLSL